MNYAEISRLYDIFNILSKKFCHEIIAETIEDNGISEYISYTIDKHNWTKYTRNGLRGNIKTENITNDLYKLYYKFNTITLKHQIFNTKVFKFQLKDYRSITEIENIKIVYLFLFLKQKNLSIDLQSSIVRNYKTIMMTDMKKKIHYLRII